MKYLIPEWDDLVDTGYDFINDAHSPEHRLDGKNHDFYMWDIFGVDKVPFDGVLVSRMTIQKNKKKYQNAVDKGIHKILRLPDDFEILGDCGAFGYIDQTIPPFDPVEILQYYSDLGFNYGVSVDHLVVPQFENQKDNRMLITYENGVKAFQEWKKKFREDFQLIVALQGWEISDYLKMYRNFIDLGVDHFGFGGLARSPTPYIMNLVDELIMEIKGSKNTPSYLHFFGLARFDLFKKYSELEDLGTNVGFDSASYLRKAWLSSPKSQSNYITIEGKGYTAIRVPFVQEDESKDEGQNKELSLKYLEQECLKKLRLYDAGKEELETVVSQLTDFNKAIKADPGLVNHYRRTLSEKPWKKCECPICRNIGIDVIIFRGNNRNRRRGFHNVYSFYNIFKNKRVWDNLTNKKQGIRKIDLSTLKKGDKILIVTECTKRKLNYDGTIIAKAKYMYQGRIFKVVRKYSETMGFPYVIISAKYGLVIPDENISGYEKVLRTNEDVENIRSTVETKLKPIIDEYDKIVVIAGDKYRRVLSNLLDARFNSIKSKGYGDLCRIIEQAIPKDKTLIEYLK